MPSRFTSTVKLYKVDEAQVGHLVAFSSEAKQGAFFEARKVQEIPNCKIIRNAPTIRINIPKADVYGCNYVSFINPDYGNKLFYHFIIGVPLYINDQCTELMISEDPIQSWMQDIDVDVTSTYVGREMLSLEKAAIAADNPYDDALWEFDTPEALPVSPELELRMYEFDHYATDSSADRASIHDKTAATLFKTDGHTEMKNILYVSPVDWTAYDTAWENDTHHSPLDPKPSEQWEILLEEASLNGGTLGSGNFVVFPDSTIMIDRTTSSKTLSNKYPTCCHIIVTNNRERERIITFLSSMNLVSAIANLIIAPRNLVDYAIRNQGSPVESYIPFDPVDVSAYHNKKLARFPFSYVRVITPAGDIAEFKYELFERLRNGDNLYEFGVYSDIIDGMKIYAAPREYKYNIPITDSASAVNPQSDVVFMQFPTAPLSIDAFLTQMSATAAQMRASATQTRSLDFSSELNQLAVKNNPLYKAAEAISAVGNAYNDIASSGMAGVDDSPLAKGEQRSIGFNPIAATMKVTDNTTNILNAALAQGKRGADEQILRHQISVINNAQAYLIGTDRGGAFAQEYANMRVAYAANIYTPPKGPGFEHYADFGWLNMGIMKVSLRQEIMERYDEYFNTFGFTSGRIGKPYIISFMQGSNSDSELPEWINGQTYCKTNEIHVTAPYQYVSKVWEAAFNSGIHWINGDELIPT